LLRLATLGSPSAVVAAAARLLKQFNNYMHVRLLVMKPGHAELLLHIDPTVVSEEIGTAPHLFTGVLAALMDRWGCTEVTSRILYSQASLKNIITMLYARRGLRYEEASGRASVDGQVIAHPVRLGTERLGEYTVLAAAADPVSSAGNAVALHTDLLDEGQVLLRRGECYDAPYSRIELQWSSASLATRLMAMALTLLPGVRRWQAGRLARQHQHERQLFELSRTLHRVRSSRAELARARRNAEIYVRTLERTANEGRARLRQAQESLRHSHLELHQLFNIAIPLCVIDRNLTIVRVNDSFCTYFGLSQQETIGRPCYEIVRSSMCRTPQCFFKQVVGGINLCEFEEEIVVRGRRRLSCMITAVPFRSETGDLLGIVENFVDISLLKRTEISLRASEERYRRLAETSNDVILATDESGVITYINQAGVALSRYAHGQIIGHPVSKLLPQLPFPGAAAGGIAERHHLETAQLLDALGHSIAVEVSTAHLQEQGRFSGVLLYIRDISERIVTQRRIQESLQEKEALLREIHHRVKNNLQIISSLLDMAGNRSDDPRVSAALSAARTKIFAMALIHAQLYQSKRFDRIDMDAHVRDLTTNLAAIYGSDKPVELVCPRSGLVLSVTQAIPCALVLNELISNAYKHAFGKGQPGRIEITLARNDDNWMQMQVSDNGCGMPTTLDVQHTGSLGLKLVRTLVLKQLHGRLTIDNHDGTRVHITFPILAQEEIPNHEADHDRR
jgi:PAS domain S-box-containing protein